jgi:hypothetical protein
MAMRVRSVLAVSAFAAALLFAACPPSAAQAQQPCCGPISDAGQRLIKLLDSTGVDHLWRAGWHIDWRTGVTDHPDPGGKDAKTHCSAFAASVAEGLGIYLLHPPEHRQQLLANAQLAWLAAKGAEYGWQDVPNAREAQRLANSGMLVVAAFQNPDAHKPGHIAVIRPSLKTAAELAQDGPQETQAGKINAISISTVAGFSAHPGAWEPGDGGGIRYYAHTIDWSGATSRQH